MKINAEFPAKDRMMFHDKVVLFDDEVNLVSNRSMIKLEKTSDDGLKIKKKRKMNLG